MDPALAVFIFLVLDHTCGAWTLTYFGDRIISFGGAASTIGLFVAFRALCTTFAAPIFGRYSDKIGRRPIAIFVATGTLLTVLLEYLATDLTFYGLSRFTFGASRACLTVCNGMICDLVPDDKKRGAAIGQNFAGVGMGFLFGAFLGGYVAGFDEGGSFATPSLVNLGLATFSLIWVLLFIKETKVAHKSEDGANGKTTQKQVSLFGALQTILGEPALRALFIFHALLIVFNAAPQHAYGEYLRTELGLSPAARGIAFVIVGLTAVAAQMLFPKIVKLTGEPRFVDVFVFGCAASSFIAPLGGLVFFAVGTLLGTFFGVVPSLSLSKLSSASPSYLSGTVNGLHESINNLALVIGGILCPIATEIAIVSPFWTSAVCLLALQVLLRPSLLYSQTQTSPQSTSTDTDTSKPSKAKVD